MATAKTLHENLWQAAAQRPDHPLFVGGKTGPLSYGEAAEQAAAVAGGLRAAGVARGDRVAFLLPDRPEFLVGYYGALAAGAAVVPLSPDTKARSLTKLLRRIGARAVLTTPRGYKLLADALLGGELPELRLLVTVGPSPGGAAPPLEPPAGLAITTWDELLASGTPWRDEGVGASDLAVVMFTSGTTAAPKGVMSSHAIQRAAVASIVEYLELSGDERMAMVLPYFYSYGLSVLHTHVAVGGTLCLVGSIAFPAAVLRGVAEHRCTGLSGVPSTFARLLHSKLIDKHELSSLRYLTQAGGPMSPALTERVISAFPSARLFVMYGQTEATPRLSYLPPAELSRKLGSVGKAIPGVTLRVLRPDSTEAAGPNETGELVASGPNIMSGYWNDPEETARVLRPEGLRTGDLARVDEEGFFYIVGRQSDMIKAGSHRIAPQEIEAAIERMPEVVQCGVVGVPDELDGEAIAAYAVATKDATLDDKAILRACLEELPRYKLPAHVRIVESLPRTDAGKLRRGELREWFAREQAAASGEARQEEQR